jgi:hypothetical protein
MGRAEIEASAVASGRAQPRPPDLHEVWRRLPAVITDSGGFLEEDRREPMVFVRVVVDKELLKRVDRAANRHKVNRSALIRQALPEHLKRLHKLEIEECDQRGYRTQPQRVDEYNSCEEAAAWPED